MHFSKTFVIALSTSLLLGACGNSGEKSATTQDTAQSASSGNNTPANPSTSTADDKALELIGSSDCTTCHRLHEAASGASIGPAYDQVAAKYSPAKDTTVERLVKKVIAGGSGVWGTVPMTPHPNLKADDVKTMVTYILSLKKS